MASPCRPPPYSVSAVLKESEDSAGVLVGALEKAVSVIKADPSGRAAAAPASAATSESPPEPLPASESKPDSETAEPDIPVSFRVRLRAWWNGVDPGEPEAAAEGRKML